MGTKRSDRRVALPTTQADRYIYMARDRVRSAAVYKILYTTTTITRAKEVIFPVLSQRWHLTAVAFTACQHVVLE